MGELPKKTEEQELPVEKLEEEQLNDEQFIAELEKECKDKYGDDISAEQLAEFLEQYIEDGRRPAAVLAEVIFDSCSEETKRKYVEQFFASNEYQVHLSKINDAFERFEEDGSREITDAHARNSNAVARARMGVGSDVKTILKILEYADDREEPEQVKQYLHDEVVSRLLPNTKTEGRSMMQRDDFRALCDMAEKQPALLDDFRSNDAIQAAFYCNSFPEGDDKYDMISTLEETCYDNRINHEKLFEDGKPTGFTLDVFLYKNLDNSKGFGSSEFKYPLEGSRARFYEKVTQLNLEDKFSQDELFMLSQFVGDEQINNGLLDWLATSNKVGWLMSKTATGGQAIKTNLIYAIRDNGGNINNLEANIGKYSYPRPGLKAISEAIFKPDSEYDTNRHLRKLKACADIQFLENNEYSDDYNYALESAFCEIGYDDITKETIQTIAQNAEYFADIRDGDDFDGLDFAIKNVVLDALQENFHYEVKKTPEQVEGINNACVEIANNTKDDRPDSRVIEETIKALSDLSNGFEKTINHVVVDSAIEIVKKLTNSNSSEIKNIGRVLVAQILESAVIENEDELIVDREKALETYEKIAKIFTKNNLPTCAKYFLVFTNIHPPEKFDREFTSNSMLSPVLKKAENYGPHGRYAIMLRDLIRSSIDSNSNDLRKYLENAKHQQKNMDAIVSGEKTLEDIPEEERPEFEKFISHLIAMHNNSEKGKESKIDVDSEITKELLETINDKLGVTARYSASDRMVRYFMYFNGIKSVDEALMQMDSARDKAEARNMKLARESMNNNSELPLKKGQIIKNLRAQFLDDILQNGSNAKEFLGGSVDSDATPLDTDITIIASDSPSITQSPELGEIENGAYGSIWIVLDSDASDFDVTRVGQEDYGLPELTDNPDERKYEMFYSGVIDKTHYGIRTGFGSTMVRAIIVGKTKDDGEIEKTCFRIVKNGFYIPVYDKETGKLVFTPEQYEEMRSRFSGNHEYNMGDYEIASPQDFAHDEKRIAELSQRKGKLGERLSALATINAKENKEADDVINNAIISAINARVQQELGLQMRNEISEDVTPGVIEYSNTGSTGRGTNVPGDGDFDYMFRIDSEIFRNPDMLKKVSSIIKSAIIMDKESGERDAPNEAIRTTNVTVDGLDRRVDIDISFTRRSDKITYASENAVEDYLGNFEGEDRDRVVRNIIAAKALFKAHECYKPKHAGNDPDTGKPLAQGGLGGIGTENWILQNGGSLTKAARTFLMAAGMIDENGNRIPDAKPKSLEQFCKDYQIWDLGKNHVSEEKNKYPHDNFISNNLDQEGYIKMIGALFDWLDI